MDFKSFDFHPSVTAGIKAAGYINPTPIQAEAIPTIIKGRDVMGLAQTGTGKTAAFALPILHRLMQGKRGHVRTLVIAPTRELAEQINDSFIELGKETRFRTVTVYGGVGANPQIMKLKRGAEIVVACPGRLLDLIGQGVVDLRRVETLVLDEADQMFDMGFFPTIRKIMTHLPKKRQTLLLSATMPSEIRHLAKEVLRDPVTVQVDTIAPAVTVSHAIYPVAQHLKTPMLLNLLKNKDTGSVLVFTRTKYRAKKLGERLVKAGHRATSLQGNLSQSRRQAALSGFKDRTFQILVATDIAARGIDVSQISHVINYDIPSTTEAYIHRIGRTGRAASTGDAFTLVTPDDNATVRAIERVLGSPLKRRTIEDFDYDIAAPRKDREFARPPRQPSRRPGSAGNGRPARGKRAAQPGSTGTKPQSQQRKKAEGSTYDADMPSRRKNRSRNTPRRSRPAANM